MRKAIWIGFFMLVLLWTGGVWLTAEVARWVASVLASGQAVDWAVIASGWKLPAWLAWWVDAAWIEAVLGATVAALEAVRDLLPWLEGATGWIVAALWLLWAGGALLMLVAAALAHVFVGRRLVPSPGA